MPTDEEVEAAAKAMCKADGTAQCAAICLSYSSHFTRNGECPEAFRVHGRKARTALTAAERVRSLNAEQRGGE